MILVLSLLIYSFAEWRLREKLKETGQSIPNQLNKPTQRPTMRWVFEIFMGVIQSIATDGGKIIKTGVFSTPVPQRDKDLAEGELGAIDGDLRDEANQRPKY